MSYFPGTQEEQRGRVYINKEQQVTCRYKHNYLRTFLPRAISFFILPQSQQFPYTYTFFSPNTSPYYYLLKDYEMSAELFLNSVTMHERFMPYELGRQLQRFNDDYPELLTMLTDEDWEWVRDACSEQPTPPDEERYPAEWATSTESISNVLPRWRRYMRSNHPYEGFVAECYILRRPIVMDKNDPRLKRNTNDSPDLEGQSIGQKKPTEMNQDTGTKVADDVDSEQEGMGQ